MQAHDQRYVFLCRFVDAEKRVRTRGDHVAEALDFLPYQSNRLLLVVLDWTNQNEGVGPSLIIGWITVVPAVKSAHAGNRQHLRSLLPLPKAGQPRPPEPGKPGTPGRKDHPQALVKAYPRGADSPQSRRYLPNAI